MRRPVTRYGEGTLVLASRRLENLQRSQELLDTIITRVYRVGVSLQAAADLVRDTAGLPIEEALRTLDDIISRLRDSTFAD
jgi:hypothetical protein